MAQGPAKMSKNDLHYLRIILRRIQDYQRTHEAMIGDGPSLADEIEWLDCFIEKCEMRQLRPS